MRSPKTLRAWTTALLPDTSRCAQGAAAQLVGALLLGLTTSLSQLARQLPRACTARVGRQFLARWLNEPATSPELLYAHLTRAAHRVLGRSRSVALLVDFTFLENTWAVLQISIAWQGRALPLYRAVLPRQASGQTQLLLTACTWLKQHLPGRLARYVLVMDRGFPSHALITELTQQGWRFVLRASGKWKMTHPTYSGRLREATDQPHLVGPVPRLLAGARLGRQGKGQGEGSVAHVVFFHGEGYAEPWFLLTSEPRAGAAVALYRTRMQIEGEFRDLKGSWGLDELRHWHSAARVAQFLAWVAVYEWRLAYLWQVHHLQQWGQCLVVHGPLSWIRTTREWIQRQLRPSLEEALARL